MTLRADTNADGVHIVDPQSTEGKIHLPFNNIMEFCMISKMNSKQRNASVRRIASNRMRDMKQGRKTQTLKQNVVDTIFKCLLQRKSTVHQENRTTAGKRRGREIMWRI